jgi:hypothetical protein
MHRRALLVVAGSLSGAGCLSQTGNTGHNDDNYGTFCLLVVLRLRFVRQVSLALTY